jgi:hypothetical protein
MSYTTYRKLTTAKPNQEPGTRALELTASLPSRLKLPRAINNVPHKPPRLWDCLSLFSSQRKRLYLYAVAYHLLPFLSSAKLVASAGANVISLDLCPDSAPIV